MMYEDDVEYADGRLRGTIVRVDCEPVFVNEVISVKGEVHIQGFYLADRSEVSTPITNVNLEPVPLGYVNTFFGARYLCRRPIRNDWRQGLRDYNCVNERGENVLNEVPLENLRETILGIYPSFDLAVRDNSGKSIAFSRNFALTKDKTLLYKGKPVGVKDILAPTHSYLSRHLEVSLG